jgi:hypothetical protein
MLHYAWALRQDTRLSSPFALLLGLKGKIKGAGKIDQYEASGQEPNYSYFHGSSNTQQHNQTQKTESIPVRLFETVFPCLCICSNFVGVATTMKIGIMHEVCAVWVCGCLGV